MILGGTNGFSVVCLHGAVSFAKLNLKKEQKSQKNSEAVRRGGSWPCTLLYLLPVVALSLCS